MVANKGVASIFLLSFVFSSRRPSCLTPLFWRSSVFPGLPAGPPGCGKTLTAKAISKLLRKTLYVVTAGDLGITASEVKRNLEGVLDVCSTCDALVLVDEADMFLETPPLDADRRAKVWRNLVEFAPARPGDLKTDDSSLLSGWRARLRCPRGGGRTSLSFVVAAAATNS